MRRKKLGVQAKNGVKRKELKASDIFN